MTKTHTSFNHAAAVLWASAFIITALIILQAGRMAENPAYAEMAIDRGSYSLMTADSGRGSQLDPDELLYIIDSRDQVLLVYEVEDARQKIFTLRDGGSLENMFNRARR
ncbi:MAG TPA: hypothetical protein VG711_10955 [Phycisphaerales bacterium]|nr:hypothetical protein [Phycisphaerales bacterium]